MTQLKKKPPPYRVNVSERKAVDKRTTHRVLPSRSTAVSRTEQASKQALSKVSKQDRRQSAVSKAKGRNYSLQTAAVSPRGKRKMS